MQNYALANLIKIMSSVICNEIFTCFNYNFTMLEWMH